MLGILTSAHLNAQDIYDALEYTESNVSGTARFNAMSGAFSALGGDISSVFSNPAGSAVLNNNNFSFSLSSNNYSNENTILGTSEKKSKNNFGFDQIGGAIIYNNIDPDSKWKKFVFALNYNKTNNNNNRFGVNNFNNENSIVADSPNDFANAILHLLNSDEKANEIAQSGFYHIEKNFSNKIIFSELNNFLNHKI